MMDIIQSGWEAIVGYVTIPRIITLTIAFFLSGAIGEFLSQGAVLRYFGPKANKGLAYFVASISGVILAVCSCSVLPMFASIRKKGAGIGPAVTFLFAGPAINLLAITFTFSLLGSALGILRITSAIVLSIVLGLLMYLIFRKHEVINENESMFASSKEDSNKWWQKGLLLVLLVGMLFTGVRNPVPTLIQFGLLIAVMVGYFKKNDLISWAKTTFQLAKKIVPLFLIGIFIAGAIEALLPSEQIVQLVGNNSFSANVIAATFGAFMYFATLTEVPIIQSFLNLGMLQGPALALLLAGPSLSLPNMIVIGKVMGLKRVSTYVVLVILLAATIGWFTAFIGLL